MSAKNKKFSQSYVGTQELRLKSVKHEKTQKDTGLDSRSRERLIEMRGLSSGILGTGIGIGITSTFTVGSYVVLGIALIVVLYLNGKIIMDDIKKEGIN
jgi:hypothetical protein